MAAPYPYLNTLQEVARRCEELFGAGPAEYGDPLDEEELEEETDALAESMPQQVLAYAGDCNGFELSWEPTAAQEKLGLGSASGSIVLLDLDMIDYDWRMELLVSMYEGDEREHYQNLARHLKEFHLVDQFADESCVGIYCNESRNPELYFYGHGEGDLPDPLGVDLAGYVELLRLSLGYRYWQLLLAELTAYFDAPAPREPFEIAAVNAQEFVDDMTKLNPDFTLEAFMARYEQVRLRR